MIKLTGEIKQFYIENPEGVQTRKRLGWKITECLTRTYNLTKYIKEIEKEFEKLWSVAESFWIFPEDSDYIKIIDKVYKLNK